MHIQSSGKGIFSKAGSKCHILRYLLVFSMLLLLTACSELRVIGGAAMKELKADGINMEQKRYHLSKY